ncbi:glycosyltransferase family 39 protein [Bacteroidales bacterium OttesenSCG-928-L19]|nr:glycosyltransferase family 39 protein [Bacteroidales bacterium OttesenSCG-928-L19]
MYARFLDWGYFDHPPMVALFIKIGSFIKGELGTRLMAILSQILVLWLLWKIIDEKSPDNRKVLLFFGIAASIIMFQIYGFVITPDVPLLLFTTLFLLIYKRFLAENGTRDAILLGVVMAGMIYSKYHALLVIGLVVLSNLKLLLNKRFYLSVAITLLLLIPHIHWQYIHDFPSFSYHLISRSDGFSFINPILYWVNQLVVFNPVMFVLTIFILFKYKPENLFERALFFIIGGVIAFFFLMSFRGHVEPHWTIVIALPIIILFYKYALKSISFKKILNRFVFPVIILILFFGVELVVNLFNLPHGFSHNREFAEKTALLAGERPIAFENSYQKASVYSYYTGKKSTSINNTSYRQNQYDIWNFDADFFNKPVLMQIFRADSATLYCKVGEKEYHFLPVQHFMPVSKIKIDFDLPKKEFKEGESITLPITIFNPYPFDIDFNHPEFPVNIDLLFAKNKKRWTSPVEWDRSINILKAGEIREVKISFTIDENGEKKYQMGISLHTPLTYHTYNSRFEKIKIQ